MISALKRNFASQIYSQLVTLIVQLGTVPFLVSAWGIKEYGVWLLLTAIPAYLALADFGFTYIAKNDMLMRVSRGERVEALITYQSIFVLLVLITFVFAFFLGLAIVFSPLEHLLNLSQQDFAVAQSVLILQFSSVFLYQFFLLFCSGLRCEGMSATEAALAASGRLAEALSIVTTALLGGGLVAAATAALIMRICFIFGTWKWLRIKAPWLRLGLDHFRLERLTTLSAPSISYMLVPISNAILIQAPLVILGTASSPATVAIFSVTRTVARLGMSGANMLSYAFSPEYSRVWAANDLIKFQGVMKRHCQLFLLGLSIYLAVGFFLNPLGVRLISGGSIDPIDILGWILVIGVALEMIWNALLTPLVSLNVHHNLPSKILGSAVVAIFIGMIFPSPSGLAISITFAHAVMVVFVISAFNRSGLKNKSIT